MTRTSTQPWLFGAFLPCIGVASGREGSQQWNAVKSMILGGRRRSYLIKRSGGRSSSCQLAGIWTLAGSVSRVDQSLQKLRSEIAAAAHTKYILRRDQSPCRARVASSTSVACERIRSAGLHSRSDEGGARVRLWLTSAFCSYRIGVHLSRAKRGIGIQLDESCFLGHNVAGRV